MKMIVNLQDLLVIQLRELYNSEKQQHFALSLLRLKANSNMLRLAIQNHLDETQWHINRLEMIFKEMDVASSGEESEAMKELIKSGYDIIERSADQMVMDAAIIASIQYMKHYEIAGYGTACAFTKELELKEVLELLGTTLKDEKRMDKRLSEIAADQINKMARAPVIV